MEEKISIEDEVFSLRLLMFIEQEPQSNTYRQVILNSDQLKKITYIISNIVEKNGDEEIVDYKASKETYTLPDLQEIHD